MMKRFISFLIASVAAAVIFAFPSFADSGKVIRIIDDYDHISAANEKTLLEKAQQLSDKTGFNIIIVVSDDIGSPKTDSHVIAYADDIYDDLCGINTDGVLLLINNDTKYDWISTSGSAINYLSDPRIDSIYDTITPELKDGNYGQAAYYFLYKVETYYDLGKANSQTELFGLEIDPDAIIGFVVVFGFIPIIVTIAVYGANARQYKLAKPSTAVYMVKNSLYFIQNTDTYIGTNVQRTYSPRSSGSSGHGGSHHSSTHHSSSGGRHGGGGRHR